jgi:hypothetical protein
MALQYIKPYRYRTAYSCSNPPPICAHAACSLLPAAAVCLQVQQLVFLCARLPKCHRYSRTEYTAVRLYPIHGYARHSGSQQQEYEYGVRATGTSGARGRSAIAWLQLGLARVLETLVCSWEVSVFREARPRKPRHAPAQGGATRGRREIDVRGGGGAPPPSSVHSAFRVSYHASHVA